MACALPSKGSSFHGVIHKVTQDEMKILDDMEDAQSIQFLIDRLKSFKTNDEFFTSMKGGASKKTK